MANVEKYHHGNLREALIDGACQQIEEGGAIALNLSKLAQKIGVSQPAVYRHFPSKQALAISVAHRGFEQLANALQKTQRVENDPFESIRTITQAYVDFALHHPEMARLMFSLKERTTEPALQSASKAAAVPLYALVETGKRCNTLRNDDVDQAVRIIWASIHGLAMLLMDEQLPFITQSGDNLSEHIEATARALHIGLFTM
jgi:AcrR family transcriptional regulator